MGIGGRRAGLAVGMGALILAAWAWGADLSFTGWLEVVGGDAVTVRLANGILIDAALPDRGGLTAEGLAEHMHVGDRVKMECNQIEPLLNPDSGETHELIVAKLTASGKTSAAQLAAALGSQAWREDGNLLQPVAPVADNTEAIHDDAAVAKLRASVLQYAAAMPNYVADETQTRADKMTPRSDWHQVDTLRSEINFIGMQETRDDITRDGEAWTRGYDALPGFHWEGSYGERLLAIFGPECGTQFQYASQQEMEGRNVQVYRFTQPPDHCAGMLTVNYQRYFPAVKGEVFFDASDDSVLRLEETMDQLPRAFPIRTSVDVLVWSMIAIGDERHLLQSGSEAEIVDDRGESYRVVNQYNNYRRFEASHKIIVK